jgi:cysteine desulfurase
MNQATYLDCAATPPVEPAVADLVSKYFKEEVGNPSSRTHAYGLKAKQAVQAARDQIAKVVDAEGDEVLFTSGATESDNLAILGLAAYGEKIEKKHIISSAIEHKAVLEPIAYLEKKGFTVTLIKPNKTGAIRPEDIKEALRPDTLLVSIMHVNNETGIKQPLLEITELLREHDAFFHVDAAQGFGKDIDGLLSKRIDLISASSHKVYGPVGVGALIARKRHFSRPPLASLFFGGGQEKGLRSGTLPTPLIVGFGLAAELALSTHTSRNNICMQMREKALQTLKKLNIQINGAPDLAVPHILNFSVPNVDSEAIILALKDVAAISNGSACTSQKYTGSHVLENMGLDAQTIRGAVRFSWSHLTPKVDWENIAERIASII